MPINGIINAIDIWQFLPIMGCMATERIHVPIDRFGRVVLPKKIRDRLGVRPGTEFEVEEREDVILLKPVVGQPMILEKDGLLVVKSESSLSEDAILTAIEKVREERNERW